VVAVQISYGAGRAVAHRHHLAIKSVVALGDASGGLLPQAHEVHRGHAAIIRTGTTSGDDIALAPATLQDLALTSPNVAVRSIRIAP
jgi:hypothetical protein